MLLTALPCCLAASAASAATVTWTGASGTTWSTADSWSPNAPTSTDSLQLADVTTDNALVLDSGTQTIDQFLYRSTGSTAFAVRTTTNSLLINGGLSAPSGVTGNYLSIFGNVVVDGNQSWAASNISTASLVLGQATNAAGTTAALGSVTLNGNLTWSGSSMLQLQATTVTGTGNIVMNAGTLRYSGGVSSNLNVQGIGTTVMNNASQLNFQVASGNLATITRAIQMNGTSKITNTNSIGGKTSTIAAPIEFTGTHTVTVSGNTWNFSGIWSGAGNVQLATSGVTSFTLSGANTFSGAMRLTSGTTRLSNVLGLQNATLDLASGDTGVLSLVTAGTYTIGALTGSRGFDLGTQTVEVGNSNASTTYSGELSNGSLAKVGSGIQTLSGTSSFSGGTTISAGTLMATAAGALGSGPVTVNVGGTLRTTPGITLANSLSLAGGAVGQVSPEALATVANVVAGTAGSPVSLAPVFAWSPRSEPALSDILALTGTVGNVQILSLSYDPTALGGADPGSLLLGWLDNGSWVNATAGNLSGPGGSALFDQSGSFASLGITPTAAYLGSWGRDPVGQTVWAVVDHNSQFTVTAVPEPATLLLAAVGLAAVASVTRRPRGFSP